MSKLLMRGVVDVLFYILSLLRGTPFLVLSKIISRVWHGWYTPVIGRGIAV
jgi:hypothetical protein